jgi:opacity protein-like surface antigen
MKIRSLISVSALCLFVFSAACHAAPFNLTFSVGPSMPVGDFGEKEDIVELGYFGTYDATGGGAETGIGFNVELEVQAARRIYAGGRFGYSRHGADASDIVNTFLMINGVTEVDANWTFTTLGAFVRVVALQTPVMSIYGRGGLGASKMKNSFDVTFPAEEPGGQTATITSDFDLGSQFYFAGTLGLEYRLSERIHLISEFRFTNLRSDGAEATASFMEYSLTGTQAYNTSIFDAVFGVRIPLSGI